jgi:hypothetical protein
MIKAVFSNGYEDIYRGDRKVTAAWMITEISTGYVVASGHSMNLETAAKTAKGNCPTKYSGYTGRMGAWARQELAKKLGIRQSEVPAYCKAVNAELAARYKVEVISL